jgi:glyoxylase-like metal-dependent hydrolase (beta-lactamase superfamily II)
VRIQLNQRQLSRYILIIGGFLMDSHETHDHSLEAHGHSHGEASQLNRRQILKRSALGLTAAGLAAPTVGALAWQTLSPAPPVHADNVTYDPVPPIAQGPAIPASGYLVQHIGRGLYWVGDGFYQMLFVVSSAGVIVIDAPPTLGQNILRAIASVTSTPITHVIYSHSHADHIGAASIFPSTAVRIAQEQTARLLSAVNDPNRPLPTVVVKQHSVLEVGDQTIILDYKGPNHDPGNLFMYLPEQQTLMLVDVIFPGWVPFKELAVSADIPDWILAHDQVLNYSFQNYIGGHLTRLGTRQDVITQRSYIQDLKANAQQTLETFDPTPIFQQYGTSNPWVIFQVYLDQASQLAGAATLARWRGQLGGADVFTTDNAYRMLESLRIDSGVLGPFGIKP